MRRRVVDLAGLLLVAIVHAGCRDDARTTPAPPAPLDPDLAPLLDALRRSGADVEVEACDDGARGMLRTPSGERHPLLVWATNKGNGGITLGGLMIRLRDAHDDGVVFDPWSLSCRWLDVDRDGYADLLVEGVAVLTEAPVQRVPVRGVFRFEPETGQLQVRSMEGPVEFAW